MSHESRSTAAQERAAHLDNAELSQLEASRARKAVVAASLGNAMEWFDIIV